MLPNHSPSSPLKGTTGKAKLYPMTSYRVATQQSCTSGYQVSTSFDLATTGYAKTLATIWGYQHYSPTPTCYLM